MHSCFAHIFNVEVELIWNDPEFGKPKLTRNLPCLVVGIGAMPLKRVDPGNIMIDTEPNTPFFWSNLMDHKSMVHWKGLLKSY